MNVPVKIAEAGGEVLVTYIQLRREYESIELKREQIEESIYDHWKQISVLMKDYLIVDGTVSYGNMFDQSISSRHLVKNLRDENPLMAIYKLEEHMKSLRELLLDERETAIRKEELGEQFVAIRQSV